MTIGSAGGASGRVGGSGDAAAMLATMAITPAGTRRTIKDFPGPGWPALALAGVGERRETRLQRLGHPIS
jgi:hypothetical protein